MSVKCKRCGEKIFDSNAYLKISVIERKQQDHVDQLNESLKLTKEKYGKQSEEVIDVMRNLSIEKRILSIIQECKSTL